MQKIIILFKTHLDLGFTDLAENVVKNYREKFLPDAMRVARQLRGEKERFIWTTGSWLVQDYLEHGEHPELLEDAIAHGEIRWNGLPFTTHTELMDTGLFSYGIRISQSLDARFGMHTTAAKMTDVPGHTRGIIPLLIRAGIRFLHIGVNPASTPPEVPSLFRWRTEGGEEIVVMYNHDYGEMTPVGEDGCYAYFAHTGDNHGPQSADSIREIYQKLHAQYPEAELVAGTLEDLAREALAHKEKLPVIEGEIGDTWIHGIGCDPGKVSGYRGLLRYAKTLPEEECRKLYAQLLPVPEHTWGLDEKTWLGKTKEVGYCLGEHENFERSRFEAVRNTPKYRLMEVSWREQRSYLERAVLALSDAYREGAKAAVSAYKRKPSVVEGYCELQPDRPFAAGGYLVEINRQGAVSRLEKDGILLADSGHLLGKFLYEVFSEKEFERFRSRYATSDEDWAIEDFGKLGMSEAVDCYHRYEPTVRSIWQKDNHVVVRMTLPEDARQQYGGMELLELSLVFSEQQVDFDFAWFGKHATRVAEASWLQFAPPQKVETMEKLGQLITPGEVINGGNKRLHAVAQEVHFETVTLSTLDAPLVNLGEPFLLNFTRERAPVDRGVCVNLHNNTWGTNFVMWYEENARFRFSIKY